MIFYLCILGVISSSGDLRFAPMALWALPLGPGDTSDAKVRETPAFSSSYGQLSPVLSILVLACIKIMKKGTCLPFFLRIGVESASAFS